MSASIRLRRTHRHEHSNASLHIQVYTGILTDVDTSPLAFTWPSTTLVLGWLLFGSVGMIAVGYARMKEEWPPAALGVGLMVYPYFFPSGFAFWAIGIVLTILLFTPKRVLGW